MVVASETSASFPPCHYCYCYCYYCLVVLLVICWTTWSSWKFITWKKLFRCGTWIERVKLRFDWLVWWQCWEVFIRWKNGRSCGDPKLCRRMHMLVWVLLVALPCLLVDVWWFWSWLSQAVSLLCWRDNLYWFSSKIYYRNHFLSMGVIVCVYKLFFLIMIK